ncbi:ABC transporter substrate-binding protein [Labrenzia sp. PHM005]|uniref:ABC transporter substrate-binding protein n=1 Tax=Labrenzia sp. PHM005 TaxID=2590016 RepID=UPI00113FC4B7|nr:ABC transporter substrate-binding protein [Labrenzia sp. PHM005]QDG76379.1 ABC transporter substrate-binding protein [Labrenzia sp. PHM005]
MKFEDLTRRRLLKIGAKGVVTTTVLGSGVLPPTAALAKPYNGPHTWISPRGTIEVMDDYPYWVAKAMGYFGDLGVETAMEPGPADGTAVVKFLAVEQADIGFPSPGVLSFAVNAGMDLVSVFGSGNLDLFNIAFRKGEGVRYLKELEGKTVLLGSAAWQSICDPMFAAVGVDPSKINYVEAGWPTWTTALASGNGDACLAWEGLRADLTAKGLDFDYWLGMRGSPLPSNSLVVRRADLQDPDRLEFLKKYLKGWAMGSEFADRNPRAAADIVFKALPTTKANYGPRAGTESLMQIHRTFKGSMSNRPGWGAHDIPSWDNFFRILKDIGQSRIDIDVERYVSNEFIAGANSFDRAQVHADADGYELPSDLQEIDMEALETRFYSNVIN